MNKYDKAWDILHGVEERAEEDRRAQAFRTLQQKEEKERKKELRNPHRKERNEEKERKKAIRRAEKERRAKEIAETARKTEQERIENMLYNEIQDILTRFEKFGYTKFDYETFNCRSTSQEMSLGKRNRIDENNQKVREEFFRLKHRLETVSTHLNKELNQYGFCASAYCEIGGYETTSWRNDYDACTDYYHEWKGGFSYIEIRKK